MSAALLEIRDLRVRFLLRNRMVSALKGQSPYIDAVADADISLQSGMALGVVGESGSGKTTLGRAILGLVNLSAGSILLDGLPIPIRSRGGMRRWRRNVAMMFQDPIASLSPRLKVKTLITEPFRIHGVKEWDPERQTRRLLDMVGLPRSFGERYPHELSGGQARRVGVARALALSPKLIVADEPTAGLDVSVQGEILNLLSDLRRDLGVTLLLITHNLAVVRHVCNRVATMYMGRLVEEGSTDSVFLGAAHPYTRALVAAQPQPDPDRRRFNLELMGEVPSLQHRPAGCEFHGRCAHMRDRCRFEQPPLTVMENGTRTRCHFPLIG